MIENLSIDERAKKRYYDLGVLVESHFVRRVERTSEHVPRPRVRGRRPRRSLTYGQVDEQARRLASWFEEMGVRNGDVVSFQIPKWIEFCIVYVACLKAGAVMHPIAMRCNGRDLDYLINQVGAKVYLCPTFHHKTDLRAAVPRRRRKASHPRGDDAHRQGEAARTDLPILGDVLKTHAPAERPSPATSDEGGVHPVHFGHDRTPEGSFVHAQHHPLLGALLLLRRRPHARTTRYGCPPRSTMRRGCSTASSPRC